MGSIRVTCEKCGSKMDCPDSDAGRKVLCKLCFHNNLVPSAHPSWDNLELDGAETGERVTRGDDLLCATTHERNLDAKAQADANDIKQIFFASEDTPPAPPTQPKDPDKALTNVAIGIFRLKNWPCQEEPGYKAFRAKVKFHSAQLGVTSIDDYRVYATKGLLMLETPVIDLPPMQGVPLLETINEINQRSVSSVFYLEANGVMMRHALIPRPREEGFLTAAMLLQTLRQINHDRRHALTLLREAVESKRLDPLAIARAFAQPCAASAVKSHSLDQINDLANFAGLQTNMLAGQITLNKEVAAPDKCPVRVAALPGFMRGWVTLGDAARSASTWSFIPTSFRDLLKSGRGKPSQILEEINEMNKKAELLRFTYTKRQLVASAAVFPTDAPTSVEQFKVFSEMLLVFAAANAAQSSGQLAKAG